MPDFRDPGHLPNLRPGGLARHPSWLPRQRQGTTPQMIGRYPDYDVLTNADSWDHATRAVVEARLRPSLEMRFFSAEEENTLRAFCDVVMAQDQDPRVPVAEMVDQVLAEGHLDGFQYADMPEDGQTWRLVLRGLDEVAAHRYGVGDYPSCDVESRSAIVAELAKGRLGGGAWDQLNVERAFQVCMRMVLSAFYSHPWAWNEIGFGGPAYPEGYMRLGPLAVVDPHEGRAATSQDPVLLAMDLT